MTKSDDTRMRVVAPAAQRLLAAVDRLVAAAENDETRDRLLGLQVLNTSDKDYLNHLERESHIVALPHGEVTKRSELADDLRYRLGEG